MKKLLFLAILLFSATGIRAQQISHIETTKSWYYIYDQDGKRVKSLSTSVGELVGYSASFYIIKQGNSFYICYDINGKRLYSFSVSAVGEILSVTGDTFTSRCGSWIITWTKDGKRLSSRPAQK